MKGALKFVQILLASVIIGINIFQLLYRSATFPSNAITAILFLILFTIMIINKYKYKSNSKDQKKSMDNNKTKDNSKAKDNNKIVENTNKKGHKRDKPNNKKK